MAMAMPCPMLWHGPMTFGMMFYTCMHVCMHARTHAHTSTPAHNGISAITVWIAMVITVNTI